MIRNELAVHSMCGSGTNSILCSQSISGLEHFTWDQLYHEVAAKAPTFLYICRCMIGFKKLDWWFPIVLATLRWLTKLASNYNSEVISWRNHHADNLDVFEEVIYILRVIDILLTH